MAVVSYRVAKEDIKAIATGAFGCIWLARDMLSKSLSSQKGTPFKHDRARGRGRRAYA
jgi:hypothetical protein